MIRDQHGPSFEFIVNARVVLGPRVRRVLKSKKARTVAKNCTLGLRKVCKQVVQSGGIATRG